MSLDNRDPGHLLDMWEYAHRVLEWSQGLTRETLIADLRKQAALERCVEIIGEAARKVSTEFRELHPEVPWQKIVATRHVLAHEYRDINHDVFFRIVTVYVPEIVELLRPLIPPLPPDPEPETEP